MVHPQQSTFLEGQNITLDCLAVGTPRPLMTWQRDNETLTSSKGYQLTLRLENATVNDNGMYLCTIFNQFGSDQRYFDLKMIECKEFKSLVIMMFVNIAFTEYACHTYTPQ